MPQSTPLSHLSHLRPLNSHSKLLGHRLLGHRGARGECFENSRQGFLYSQQLRQQAPDRFIGIEFDVQLTADGQLVVFHDDNLQRLYHLQARVDQMTYSTLQRLTASTQPILLLSDMPKHLTGYLRIELEVKTHPRTPYPRLLAALAGTLAYAPFKNLPIVLTSFDTQLLRHLQAHASLSTLPRGLLVAPHLAAKHPIKALNPSHQASQVSQGKFAINVEGIGNIEQMPYIATRLGCTGVGLYYGLYTQKTVALCQRLGLSTSAWTVNSAVKAAALVALGVNYIISDYPSSLLSRLP